MGKAKKSENKNELRLPAETNKLVQTLKEILNSDYTDSEIYTVLQECDMNPDDAVQRLLAQDTFHEVKSKRERRKEMKEAQDSKARVSNISGVIVGMESNVGLAPSQDSLNEIGKAANMRENPSVAPSVTSSSFLSNSMITINEQPSCDRQIVGAGGTICSAEQISGGSQPAFTGGHPSGYSSLAEVVRLGRPRAGVSHMVEETAYTVNDMDSVLLGDKPQPEEVQVCEHDFTSKNHCSIAESDSSFTGQETTNKVEGASYYNDGLLEDNVFHNFLGHENEHHEVDSESPNYDMPTTALSLEQLSLGREKMEVASHLHSEDSCRVVLPKCIKEALDADCSHLSFGTYRSGVNTDIPRNLRSNPVKSNLEEASATIHGNSGSFASSYGELSGSMSDTVRLTTATVKSHEFPVSSQPDLLRQNIHDNRGYAYNNSKLAPDSIFKNTENCSSPWSAVISPPSSEFHPSHGDLRASVTRTPLAVDASELVARSVKDSDHVYPLGKTQSNNNTKRYGDIVSCSGSSVIPTEILDSGDFALPKAFSSTLPNTAGHVMPHHLPAHHYSQPAVDPGELISLNDYSADPQVYPRASSSLQQPYEDSSFFHESLVGMKPNLQKLEGIASRSSLPQPYAKISGHAKFSNSMLDDFSTIPNQSAMGYNELVGARYNEANNLAMLQQNDVTSWDYGLGSRKLPTVANDIYYNRLGQGRSLSTYQTGIQDNRYYNLHGRGEQVSAYGQGVPDSRYLYLQRQNQLLSMYQRGVPDDRYNRRVVDQVLPLSQQGLPSNRYHNLQGQSQQVAQNYAALRSRDVYGALQSPQGSSPAMPQSFNDVPPTSAQGSNKQLPLNWQNFY